MNILLTTLISLVMTYEMPKLPYANNGLEPVISQATIDYHYGKHLQTYKKMLEQPREMGEMTLKDFVPMSLRCQMRSNRKSGKCKEKQNIAGERFANHYPRRCKI